MKLIDKQGRPLDLWINNISQYPIDKEDSAFGNTFGFIKMNDGRKAQIQVKLELDEEEWED